MARHSDIRLTMSVYTHVGLADVTAAVEALGGVPRMASEHMMKKANSTRVSA